MMLNYFNATNLNDVHSTLFNGKMFFEATRASDSTELWVTDGTVGGTTIVKDINPGARSSLKGNVNYFYTAAGLFFAADDGTTGTELWKSNGTYAGTFNIFNINPGSASSNPRFMMVLNNQVLLTA